MRNDEEGQGTMIQAASFVNQAAAICERPASRGSWACLQTRLSKGSAALARPPGSHPERADAYASASGGAPRLLAERVESLVSQENVSWASTQRVKSEDQKAAA